MIILYDRAKVRHVYMILFVIFSNVALSKLPAHTFSPSTQGSMCLYIEEQKLVNGTLPSSCQFAEVRTGLG